MFIKYLHILIYLILWANSISAKERYLFHLAIRSRQELFANEKGLVYGSADPNRGHRDIRSWQIRKTEVLK